MSYRGEENRRGLVKGLSEEKSRELLDLLNDAVNLAHRLVAHSNLAPKSKPIKALSLAILFQMAEKGSSIHYLASAGLPAGLETIARTMFESHVDLQNLHNYPDDYPNYIFATGALSQRKQLDVMLKNHESPLTSLAETHAAAVGNRSLVDFRAEKETELAELKSLLPEKFFRGANKKKLETSIERRAEWAGLEEEYDWIYRNLSAISHSDLIAVTGQQDQHASNWWPPSRQACSGTAILATATYLVSAIDRVSKKLNLSRHKLPALKKLVAEWNFSIRPT